MSGGEDTAALIARTERRLTVAAALSNIAGAIIVSVFLLFLLPVTVEDTDLGTVTLRNGILGVVYMAATLPLGRRIIQRRYFERIAAWLVSGRPPGEKERRIVLRYPLVFALTSLGFWIGAALIFSGANASISATVTLSIAATLALGGVTACALQYLIVERILRPITARALADASSASQLQLGVGARLRLSWALATVVPLLGAATIALTALVSDPGPDETLAIQATLFLTGVALATGLLATTMAARSVADPVNAVRRAIERVERGDLEARVAVDDGSEIGLLQAGFNRMALGLAERERLRDLFGRQVGEDVARQAMEGEIRLGGETRDVAVLFVDMIGSTSLAAERPATEVVATLNRFLGRVVEVAERHGGWVNKFVGDEAMCVFGAPVATPEAAGDALRAARELRQALAEMAEVDVGIGVSAGAVVAGNIGSEHRYEYTVIGDPVNEAARLCELAKRDPGRLLASEAALSRAEPAERERWTLGEAVALRGRSAETRLAAPAEAAVAASALSPTHHAPR